MKSITDWLLENKIAHHWKHAENISKLLHLGELYNVKKFDEIETRARLYRDWKNTGENTKTAAEKAIAGDLIPSPLFEGVLHSEEVPMLELVKDELKPCPCGKTPKTLLLVDNGSKWAYACGDCCNEWHIEFRTFYNSLDSDECMNLAIESWNLANRGEPPTP